MYVPFVTLPIPHTFVGFPKSIKVGVLDLYSLITMAQTLASNLDHVVKVQVDSNGFLATVKDEHRKEIEPIGLDNLANWLMRHHW